MPKEIIEITTTNLAGKAELREESTTLLERVNLLPVV